MSDEGQTVEQRITKLEHWQTAFKAATAVLFVAILGGGTVVYSIVTSAVERADSAKLKSIDAEQRAQDALKQLAAAEDAAKEITDARNDAKVQQALATKHSQEIKAVADAAARSASKAETERKRAEERANEFAELAARAQKMLQEKGGVPIVGPRGPKGDSGEVDYERVRLIVETWAAQILKERGAKPTEPASGPLPAPSSKTFLVHVSGSGNHLTLRAGFPSGSEAKVSGGGGKQVVLVPQNARVLLKISGNNNRVYVPAGLEPYVSRRITGQRNEVHQLK